MPSFSAEYVTHNGRWRRERIDAIDAASVDHFIRSQRQGFPIGIFEQEGTRWRLHRLRVPQKPLLMAMSALCLLLESGVTIDVAMRFAVERAPLGKLRFMLSHIAKRIEVSGEVGESFAAFPTVFSPAVTGALKAHQDAGELQEGFKEITEYLSRMAKIKGNVLRGLFIPVLGVCAGVASASVIFGFTIPRFEKMVRDMAITSMNPLSAAFFGISRFVVAHPAFCILAVLLTPLVGWGLWRNTTVRRWVMRILMRAPISGRAIEAVALARLCATFSTLAEAGVLPHDTLEMCEDAVGHETIAEGLREVAQHVRNNAEVGEAFGRVKVFPPEFSLAVRVGQSNLPQIFGKLAEIYSREAEARIAVAIAAMEPAMTIVLGGFALLTGLAIMLPMLEIINRVTSH